MTQPNLIETIEKALSEYMGAVTEKDLEAATYEIEKEAPEWLRALLEENKKLQQKLKDYEGCKGVEDYYRVLEQSKYWEDAYHRRNKEAIELVFQLSAKNKVLEWYAEVEPFAFTKYEIRERARSILSQYPPRREEDDQT